MKKLYTLLFILTFSSSLICQNDVTAPYLSKLFNIRYSASIQADLDSKPYDHIYTTTDSTLFVVNKQGFKYSNQIGYTKIYKINCFSGKEKTYFIAPSSAYLKNGGTPSRIWIWALAACDSLLFVAVDESIWVYRHTASQQYEYLKTIAIENVFQMEIENNILHVFTKNENGFHWAKVNLANYKIENITDLVLNNRLFLQIAPLKIISIKNNALYLLQRNEPIIEKYSLTGKLLATYRLEIPNWQNIPKEVTQELDSIKDITERNNAFSKYSIFDNNFILFFHVFSSERFFLIAIDKKEEPETWMKPYFIQIIGDSTIVESYSLKLTENEIFVQENFPFLAPREDGNLIFTEIKEYIAQINRTTPIPWQNKTQKEFRHDVNLYHRDNEPIEKIETYYFKKNYIPVDSIQFLDYDDNVFLLNDIKKEKAIFIISQYPQCSTCIKVIWSYFTNKKLPNVDLYNVSLDCTTYLMKKENIKETNLFLKTEYTPIFLNTKQFNDATKQVLSQKSNPIVLLFDKKLQHIEIISSDNIIGDFMGNLKPEFINTIENFVKRR